MRVVINVVAVFGLGTNAYKQPHLFSELIDEDGNLLPQEESRFKRRLTSEQGRHDPEQEHRLGGGFNHTAGQWEKMWHLRKQNNAIEELKYMPSWGEFFEKYVKKNRPVIIKDMFHEGAPAMEKWDDTYLRKKFGDMNIDVEFEKTEVRGGPTERTTLKKFIRSYMRSHYFQKDKLYAVVPFDHNDAMLDDMRLPDPLMCEEVALQSFTLWMSSGGTSSVLHQDDAENFLIMLDGTKEFILADQNQAHDIYAKEALFPGTSSVSQDKVDFEMFPRFADVKFVWGAMSAGDMLYIPYGYWHQVTSHMRNLAVNIWWGHEQDHSWLDSDVDLMEFGNPAKPMPYTFDEMKSRHAGAMCTPRASAKVRSDELVDEESWKHFVKEQQTRIARGETPVPHRQFFGINSADIEL